MPPRRRRVDPAVREQARHDIEQIVAQTSQAAAETTEDRRHRGELLALGPELRDLDAAVDCRCSCHPRAADMSLHDGGASCRCQLTREDLQKRMAKFEKSAAEHRERARPRREARQAEFAAAVESLGVEAIIECEAAPLAIVGRCDGHSFFLRARHDIYRVEVAADPGCENLWYDGDADRIEVASGCDRDLVGDGGGVSPAVAVRVAVDAIRTSMRRNMCSHEEPSGVGHLYCRNCGVELSQAEQWRWLTA